jgi:FAD/FMN-containing dehydrogenase
VSVTFERGDATYEQARRQSVWNGRTPERYPDLIVRAKSAADVTEAVRLAADQGLRIGVKSGGHSWAGNHLRDGGLLLDVSGLDELVVDRDAMTATVGPGFVGIAGALEREGLFFPGGHCPGVAVGGYLLQGGFGWNGRVHGPACASVTAIDVVTASGELIRADDSNHQDLLWAARGSGPGFFGVVVAFHLRIYPAPRHIASSMLRFPMASAEALFTWAQEQGPTIAPEVELSIFLHRGEDHQPEFVVVAPALVDTPEEAAEALGFIAACPLLDQAVEADLNREVTLTELYDAVHQFYPDGARYAVDNMWTHAPVSELIGGIEAIAATLPPNPSAMMWMNWGAGAGPPRPDMAFSVEDDIYIAVYGVWDDPADDERYVPWPEERMRAMEHLATGIQLADENLGRRPARFITEQKMTRVDQIRAQYDPDGLFHPWMGRPLTDASAVI